MYCLEGLVNTAIISNVDRENVVWVSLIKELTLN